MLTPAGSSRHPMRAASPMPTESGTSLGAAILVKSEWDGQAEGVYSRHAFTWTPFFNDSETGGSVPGRLDYALVLDLFWGAGQRALVQSSAYRMRAHQRM